MAEIIDNHVETNDFNIYYLNFSKVYEMAMIINNQIVKSFQKEKGITEETTYSRKAGLDVSAGDSLLSSVKTAISTDYSDKHITNSKVVESIEVQTTKSTLLRRIMSFCKVTNSISSEVKEGDLIKLDNVKLRLLDEESLRQFLILKRDALKGLRVEGMEVNNLVSSMLQDYSYVLVGSIDGDVTEKDVMVKIPMETQAEFESKYIVDDVLIGKVSIVGIYKGSVNEEIITSNTFSFFRDRGDVEQIKTPKRIIQSSSDEKINLNNKKEYGEYDYLDVLAIIQDVHFNEVKPVVKLHWWNKLGLWLLKVGRKNA